MVSSENWILLSALALDKPEPGPELDRRELFRPEEKEEAPFLPSLP